MSVVLWILAKRAFVRSRSAVTSDDGARVLEYVVRGSFGAFSGYWFAG